MLDQYSDEEIRDLYKYAKNKRRQIEILMELTGYGKGKIIKTLRLGEREIQLLKLSKYEQQKKEIESMYLAGMNIHIIAGKMNMSVRRTQEYIADIRKERLGREE